MPDTPLNPDGVLAATEAIYALPLGIGKVMAERYAQQAVSAYLAVAQPEVTSVEELDQLPQGAVIMATGGQWNPDYPELFLKAGYAHAPWLALDPSDRDDGENLESSGAVLKWRCEGEARVLYRPAVKP